MNGQDPYMYLAEAGQISGYTAEYLRQLCISGKLEGHRLGKNWVTTAAAVERFKLRQLALPPHTREAPLDTASRTPLRARAIAVMVVIAIAVSASALAHVTNWADQLNALKSGSGSVVVATRGVVNHAVQDYLRNRLAALGLIIRPEQNRLGTVSGVATTILPPPSEQNATASGATQRSAEGRVFGLSISNAQIIESLKSVFAVGLPDDLTAELRGPPGIAGEQGPSGPPGPTSQYIPNSGSVFGVTVPTARNPGTIGSATYLSAQEFFTGTLTANGDITQSTGTASLNNLTVAGTSSITGSQTITGNSAISGTLTVATSITNPLVIGGAAAGSSLELRSTSGVGTTDFTKFTVGNNGNTEAMRIIDNGNVGIGTTNPGSLFTVNGTIAKTTIAKPTAGFGWISTSWTTDDIMLLGYNINPLTGLNDPTEPAVMFGLESNFNDGTDDIMEMYVQAQNTSGTTARPWFATYKRSDSTIKQFDIKAETIRLGNTFSTSLVTLTAGVMHFSGAYTLKTSSSGNFNITLDPGGTGVVDMISPVSILSSLVVGGSAETVPTEMLQIGVPTSGAATKGLRISSGFATYGDARLLQRTSGGGLFLSNNINAALELDDAARTGHAIYMGFGSGGIGFDLYSAGAGARTAVRAMFIKDGGNVGIGTTNPTARLHSWSAEGIVTIEGNSNCTTATNNVLMLRSDVASADDPVFRVQCNGATFADGAYTGTGADFAEYFQTSELGLESGDLVSVDTQTPEQIVKTQVSDRHVLGVVSTKPAFIANGPSDLSIASSNWKPVALVGRVPVKVSEENGQVHAGDRLGVSKTLAGYAMKMTESGQSIGVALADSSSATGAIVAFVNLGYQQMDIAVSADGTKITVNKDVDFQGNSLLNVRAIASASGKWSIDENGNISANSLRVKKGVTVEDRSSGQPFCVYVDHGAVNAAQGDCDSINPATTSGSSPPDADTPPAGTNPPPPDSLPTTTEPADQVSDATQPPPPPTDTPDTGATSTTP